MPVLEALHQTGNPYIKTWPLMTLLKWFHDKLAVLGAVSLTLAVSGAVEFHKSPLIDPVRSESTHVRGSGEQRILTQKS
jgi:hypothetical protein